jgi:hypothetical protein
MAKTCPIDRGCLYELTVGRAAGAMEIVSSMGIEGVLSLEMCACSAVTRVDD